MIQCPICEHENPEGAQICASCGSALSASGAVTGGIGGAGGHDGAYTPFLPKNVRLQNNKYAVGEVLGQGGFGITYKGGDMALKRYVAIKEFFPQGSIRHNSTIRPDRTLSPADYNSVKAKFIDEAHRLARFSHPSIVRVFGVFEENNTAYMVMEFLEGQSLLQRITEKRSLSEKEVVDIAHKIGDALAAVHAAGLIHRDIKPDNIMLTNDGRVVLIDFGTARSFASNKTVKQTAMLTPGYAPLEQYGQQARFGAYTDIYALGATLYHALTGELPSPATDLASGVELKAPNTINPNISQGVSNAILWAMKVKADERPQSVKAFLDALEKPAPVAPTQTPQPNAFVVPISPSVHPVPRTPSPSSNHGAQGVTPHMGNIQPTKMIPQLAVGIAALFILGAVVIPYSNRIRKAGQNESCKSNLQMIGLGLTQYSEDYGGPLPRGGEGDYGWSAALQPYLKSTQIFQCPSVGERPSVSPSEVGYTDYYLNSRTFGYELWKFPADFVFIGDGISSPSNYSRASPETQGNPPAMKRHGEGSNYLLADGSVKWMRDPLHQASF